MAPHHWIVLMFLGCFGFEMCTTIRELQAFAADFELEVSGNQNKASVAPWSGGPLAGGKEQAPSKGACASIMDYLRTAFKGGFFSKEYYNMSAYGTEEAHVVLYLANLFRESDEDKDGFMSREEFRDVFHKRFPALRKILKQIVRLVWDSDDADPITDKQEARYDNLTVLADLGRLDDNGFKELQGLRANTNPDPNLSFSAQHENRLTSSGLMDFPMFVNRMLWLDAFEVDKLQVKNHLEDLRKGFNAFQPRDDGTARKGIVKKILHDKQPDLTPQELEQGFRDISGGKPSQINFVDFVAAFG